MSQVKYLDLLGLSLYDELSKKYLDLKDVTTLIQNDQIDGHDTLVITDGAYDTTTGTATKTSVKVNIDNNSIVFKNVAGTYTAEEAAAYNTANPEATPVSEGDPKPADYKLAVADSALVQYVGGDGINIGNVVNGEKTVAAVVKTGDKVLSVDANGLQTTVNLTKLTPAAYDAETGHSSGDFATRFGTNVKEAYILTGISGQQIGTDADAILVYKDSSIISIEFASTNGTDNGQFLKYTYIDANGATQTTYVDLSTLIIEAEAGDGLAVADTADASGNKALKVKIDSTSETDGATTPAGFLSVSSNGVKISGIKDEIAREIDAVGGADAAAGKMVIGVDVASTGVSLDEAYIPTVNTTVANTVNGSAPAAGTQIASLSTVSISHDTTNKDEYAISHNIKTLPVSNAVAPTYYTAEDEDVIEGTAQVGDLKTAGTDGLTTAVDVKNYVDSQISAGTSFITNDEIEGLFTGVLSASEIATIDGHHTRS